MGDLNKNNCKLSTKMQQIKKYVNVLYTKEEKVYK